MNSCSSALLLSLKALDVNFGTKVLIPAFTFIAVPSSIILAGGVPVLVNITKDLFIDTHDLESQAKSSGAKHMILSYMRGFMPDIQEVMRIADKYNIKVIEDCAHALGNKFDGKNVGQFGVTSNVSFQSDKIINSGEGGVLATNDTEL